MDSQNLLAFSKVFSCIWGEKLKSDAAWTNPEQIWSWIPEPTARAARMISERSSVIEVKFSLYESEEDSGTGVLRSVEDISARAACVIVNM